MENRMVKFYSKESNMLALHAIPGHFATSHSHINYYVDVTSVKTRAGEAKEAAKVLYSRMPKTEYVDTIVCMDGTEVIGAFLSQEIENGGVLSTNRHETTYVVSPEINNNNQMLFRDNNKGAIAGKHVVLLLATTTTGETIRRSLECIRPGAARHYNDSFKGGFHGQNKKKQNSNLRFSLSFCIAVFSHYYLTNLYVRIL